MELSVFFAILIVFSIFDYRSMKKAKLKKEMVSYLILMVLAGAFAVFYLTNPHQESFTYLVIKLFKLKGY
ncbi:MAG: hypothetical protein CVU91_10615 [Firmicutes bacterium HGW-Firmicutes-16]|nr:MAG: hypothetical protein CVU91_10615 [Firmicutes bacterium HGW-Firmicutes-16]